MHALRRHWQNWSRGRRIGVTATAVLALVVLIASLGGDPEPRPMIDATEQAATTAGAGTSTDESTPAAEPEQDPAALRREARDAVDAGQYTAALQLADELDATTVRSIERRIANRAARVAQRALARGDRRAASRALRNAGDVEVTSAFTVARSRLSAAQDRAAARRAAERRARAERRAAARAAREAARRAAAEAERQAELAEESAASSECHPSYEGACLDPNASDYDCEGGSGDGPSYTGPVRVVGSDPYDLDRDGDGIACES